MFLYLLLSPIFVIAFTKRVSKMKKALKNKDKDKIKFEILFFFLTILTTIGMVIAIESIKKL